MISTWSLTVNSGHKPECCLCQGLLLFSSLSAERPRKGSWVWLEYTHYFESRVVIKYNQWLLCLLEICQCVFDCWIQHNDIYDAAERCNYVSCEVLLQDLSTLFNPVLCSFLLYFLQSGFDYTFSKGWQTNPAITAHEVILIPINAFWQMTSAYMICQLNVEGA